MAWGPVRNGIADLAGTPRTAIEAFSTRRREIIEHLEAHGVSGGRAAQIATYATRRAKTDVGAAVDLRAVWADKAAELGIDTGRLGEPVRAAARGVREAELFDWLAGPTGVTERRSTFDRQDVIKSLCDHLPNGAPVDDVMAMVELFLADPRVVAIGDDPSPTRWTTVDLLDRERRLVDTSIAGGDAGRAVVPADRVRVSLGEHPQLSDEQRSMVAGLLRSGDGVELVVGAAGSGKTTALAVARACWEGSGNRVIGCALAARAAQQLQDGSGIASSTLDRLLNDLATGRRTLGPTDVVVVDEAGMVGTRQLEALVSRATRGRAKVVLVGDPAQLPAIDAGGALAGLARRLGAHHLTENHRQTEDWERRVLHELRSGDADEVGATYERHGRLDLADDGIDRVVDRWWHTRRHDRDVLLLAGRRDQVRALNRAIRERLSADGAVGPDRWAANGRRFAVGDEVVALRNDDQVGVLNGTRGTITGGNRRKLTIETTDHRQVTIPIDYLEAGHLDHGYALTIHKAQGLTADETIVLADETLAREHTYVGLSRGRLTNHLSIAIADVFDDHPPEPPDDRSPSQRLDHMTSRSAAEDMGIDRW